MRFERLALEKRCIWLIRFSCEQECSRFCDALRWAGSSVPDRYRDAYLEVADLVEARTRSTSPEDDCYPVSSLLFDRDIAALDNGLLCIVSALWRDAGSPHVEPGGAAKLHDAPNRKLESERAWAAIALFSGEGGSDGPADDAPARSDDARTSGFVSLFSHPDAMRARDAAQADRASEEAAERTAVDGATQREAERRRRMAIAADGRGTSPRQAFPPAGRFPPEA